MHRVFPLLLALALSGCDLTLSNPSCAPNSIICSSPARPSCESGGRADLVASGILTQPIRGSASSSANPDGSGATLSLRDDAVEVRVYVPASRAPGARPDAGTYALGDDAPARIRLLQSDRPVVFRDAVGTMTVDAGDGLSGRIDLDAAFAGEVARLHIGGTFRAGVC